MPVACQSCAPERPQAFVCALRRLRGLRPEICNNPSVKNLRFLTPPFTQGRLSAAAGLRAGNARPYILYRTPILNVGATIGRPPYAKSLRAKCPGSE